MIIMEDKYDSFNDILYDKCMELPIGYSVRKVLYQRIVDMLANDASASGFSLALDYMICDVVASSLGEFTPKDLKIIKKYNDSIIEVKYELGDLPSGRELLHYYNYNNLKLLIKLSLNTEMTAIYWIDESFKSEYNKLVEEEKTKTDNIAEAEKTATLKIYELNERLNNKLFRVERL